MLENALTRSLQTISETDNNYLDNYSTKLTKHRNLLLQQLVQCKYDIDLWVPKGGYFILADISRVKVQEKYLLDEHGRTRTKDYAMAVQMAY